MTPEEELAQLAPEPEVQIWKYDENGEPELVLAESGEQHDRRLQVEEMWGASKRDA